ncbi:MULTISPECIES: nucleotidyl transferase AbiEii/AbiGii toxin family protein [Chryseobacterium]|uniref:Nucleotidyl transferase AbiEii/AbiGii toxin family protein n=1 Tax=Chryseobacterium sediminis TaxID=1679494 RepID=A0A5B2U4H8_9FLAO|nr:MULTISPECIES: nucleotidyl transferase AbiEii/AbiGii toxin family protein [Chryseobacterium]KAA2221412.1 nucleotidyl transferase AbiEii/AbiGii toxin family protein [Chryseobacterium sediminis]TLX27593.1 nucleotidyl transferase AbiEii/AbiGii toxin family protein [Chryseobacterium indologenes]UOU99243.1 nucleotidyl transferase AbiEii/AbiGii toxin family protein [Chryseobacterium daecheongense]
MDINKIKMLTLRALMSEEFLMHSLVLKGGNALQLAYEITNRGSIDIDFSVEREFTEEEIKKMPIVLDMILDRVFRKENLKAFDIKFELKPKNNVIPEWKGYIILFKLIELDKFIEFGDDIDSIRRNAISVHDNSSTQYSVDISAYEYVETATTKEVEGILLRVYTLEMILLEKIRALCQTMPEYKEIVPSAKEKQRARDVYDIYTIYSQAELNLEEDILREIFKAKQVPLSLINKLESLREHNRDDWNRVIQTVSADEELKEYDFYFDELLKIASQFKDLSE